MYNDERDNAYHYLEEHRRGIESVIYKMSEYYGTYYRNSVKSSKCNPLEENTVKQVISYLNKHLDNKYAVRNLIILHEYASDYKSVYKYYLLAKESKFAEPVFEFAEILHKKVFFCDEYFPEGFPVFLDDEMYELNRVVAIYEEAHDLGYAQELDDEIGTRKVTAIHRAAELLCGCDKIKESLELFTKHKDTIGYINISIKTADDILKKLKELEEMKSQLDDLKAQLKFQPGGNGYKEAKESFEKMINL